MKHHTVPFASAAVLGLAALTAVAPAKAATATNGSAQTHSLSTTAQAQWALDTAGANLPVNGVWTPATESALRQYQQAVGIPVTGQLDKTTRSWLGMTG